MLPRKTGQHTFLDGEYPNLDLIIGLCAALKSLNIPCPTTSPSSHWWSLRWAKPPLLFGPSQQGWGCWGVASDVLPFLDLPALPLGLLSPRGPFAAAQARVTSGKTGLEEENAFFCLVILGSQVSGRI